MKDSTWVLVVRPQHRRLTPSVVPAQRAMLKPGFLAHRTGLRQNGYVQIYDDRGKSWVAIANLRPAAEPKGWDTLVVKIHPALRHVRTVSHLPLPPASVAPRAAVVSTAAPVATAAAAPQPTAAPQVVQVVQVVQPAPVVYGTDPASIEQELIARGDAEFGAGQGQYLANVVRFESAFRYDAINPSSGAAGLFQALPPSKLGCYLSDVQCQINWGVGYIRSVYGTPYNAWQHELAFSWY